MTADQDAEPEPLKRNPILVAKEPAFTIPSNRPRLDSQGNEACSYLLPQPTCISESLSMDDLKPHGTNGRSKLQTFHDEVSPSVAALQENTNGLLRLKADEGCIPSLRRSGISAPRSTNLIKFLYIPLCRRKISTSAGSPPTTKPAWASRHRSCYFPFAFSGGQSGETPKVLGRKQQKCAESGGGGGRTLQHTPVRQGASIAFFAVCRVPQ